jgi:hypothetical protein
MMTIAVFVAAVLVSLVLDRQERRHRFHLSLEYEYLGWEMPRLKPRLSRAEAVLSIVVGAVLLVFGCAALYAMLRLESIGEVTGGHYIVAAFLAAGVALITVGWKGLRESREYPKHKD